MDTVKESAFPAHDLVERASAMLDAAGDKAGAIRLRHTLAIIRNDERYPTCTGLAAPLSLMRMAIALLDRDGSATATTYAAMLQGAIDHVRGAKPLRDGEELDPDLLLLLLAEFDSPRLH